MASCYYISKLSLRVLQAVLALVAFAASAYIQTKGHHEPRINFFVFVGVTGWLLSMLYAAVSCAEGLQRMFWGIVEVALSAVWAVFWMAAAASYAADHRCKPSQIDPSNPWGFCTQLLTSQGCAWLSWLLWLGSLALAVVDWRRGEGLGGGGVRY